MEIPLMKSRLFLNLDLMKWSFVTIMLRYDDFYSTVLIIFLRDKYTMQIIFFSK